MGTPVLLGELLQRLAGLEAIAPGPRGAPAGAFEEKL